MVESSTKVKTIRDAVHGDVLIPQKFVKIIDTPEFQRLHRIRQLSTAYLLFPTAEHTRFSHSIGAFYTMKLLIDHFEPILNNINVEITDRERDLAMSVALLHDVGHGPFSHAFEDALPNTLKQKKHEEWTIDIINSSESSINRAIIDNFGKNFPAIIATLIRKDYKIRGLGSLDKPSKKIDLLFIISSLISSQLDADRMDYLLRDAYFTGVSYGKFDLSRLLSALTLTVHHNNFYVCVQEKYLPTIEEYLLARYHMHDGIYLHRFKCEMELLLKKILFRAYELYKSNKLKSSVPAALEKILKGQTLSIRDYVSLDDAVMMSSFLIWKDCDDPILAELCSALLDRRKFKALTILDNSKEDVDDFESQLKEILNRNNFDIDYLDKSYYWLKQRIANVGYNKKKENIWILRNDGVVDDLSNVSKLITEKFLIFQEKYISFISYDILRLSAPDADIENIIKDIEDLINLYSIRKHIEIEKKYIVKQSIFDNVLQSLKEWGEYEIIERNDEKNIDTYYDSADDILNLRNITVRIRKKGNSNTLTIKMPPKKVADGLEQTETGQTERYEFEIKIPNDKLESAKDYLLKHIRHDVKDIDVASLIPKMIITTERKKKILRKGNILFEMVFDYIKYESNENKIMDYQIEIELKSEYIHRINLKILSDYLESNIEGLEPTQDSKYKRGVKLMNLLKGSKNDQKK